MQKILVIQTGGTISTTEQNGCRTLDKDASYEIRDALQARTQGDVSFSFTTPFFSLSENITPAQLEHLASTIDAAQNSKEPPTGYLVTHGSDTLCYTANYLAYRFPALTAPIVLCCSLHPLGHAKSNGGINLFGAASFLTRAKTEGGVYVVNTNLAAMRPSVHLATRLLSPDFFVGDFLSRGAFGYISGAGKFVANNNLRLKPKAAFANQPLQLSQNILYHKAVPFVPYPNPALLPNKPDCVFVEPFHSGTVYHTDAFLSFLNRCLSLGIDVVVAPTSDTLYESFAPATAYPNLIELSHITCESAFVKTALAYGSFDTKEQRLYFLTSNIANEFWYKP